MLLGCARQGALEFTGLHLFTDAHVILVDDGQA